MTSVLDHTDVSKMHIPRSRVERIGIGIKDWPLRRRSRRYHPFAACDLGFEEAISQHRYDRDRIEHEDQQYHGVDQVDVELVVWKGDHQLETDPVKQGQGPGQFCIPWAPEPVRRARRRRWRGSLFWCRVELINILHLQSLSKAENSTASLDGEPADHRNNAPIAVGKPLPILPPSPFPSSLRLDLRSGSEMRANSGSGRKPR